MSSIPSSAMPHAKSHDDDEHAHEHGGQANGATPPKLADVKQKAADLQEKVSDEAAKLAWRAKAEAREHTTAGIVIGAAVAIGAAALAAIPFFLSKSDARKPKPRKAKPKPKAKTTKPAE